MHKIGKSGFVLHKDALKTARALTGRDVGVPHDLSHTSPERVSHWLSNVDLPKKLEEEEADKNDLAAHAHGTRIAVIARDEIINQGMDEARLAKLITTELQGAEESGFEERHLNLFLNRLEELGLIEKPKKQK